MTINFPLIALVLWLLGWRDAAFLVLTGWFAFAHGLSQILQKYIVERGKKGD